MATIDLTRVTQPWATLPSSIDQIARIEDLLWEIFRRHALPESHFSVVYMALTEAASNAIRHGNAANPEKEVKIFVDCNGRSLHLCVEDEGKGFDPENLADPTDPDNLLKEGGRGVFLMRKFADDLRFEQNGSRVIMSFNFE